MQPTLDELISFGKVCKHAILGINLLYSQRSINFDNIMAKKQLIIKRSKVSQSINATQFNKL